MARKVEKARIEKFYKDRNILEHYNDIDIAVKMRMDKSSYSSYMNGRRVITNQFLKRFYVAFGVEIDELRARNQFMGKEVELYLEKYDQIEESCQQILICLQRLGAKVDVKTQDRDDQSKRLEAWIVEAIRILQLGKSGK